MSTEIFDWGFLYLLVGKVGVQKNDWKVQEFKTPILISSFIVMKHYRVFLVPRASGIDREHALVFSADALGDSLFWSFDEFLTN